MERKLLIHCTEKEEHIVVLENGQVVEYRLHRADDEPVAGSIYTGKVSKVLPGMQAAFVDIGAEKNAFLQMQNHIHETHPFQNREGIKQGEEIIVQVKKEAVQDKGAKVTTEIHLPGSYVVYLPQGGSSGVSQRIGGDEERRRLQKLAEKWRKEREGYILRTASEGVDEAILTKEMHQLRETWSAILREAQERSAPACLNQGTDDVLRMVQDYMNAELEVCLIDDRRRYRRLRSFFHASPFKDRIRIYEGNRPLLDEKIESEVHKALHKKVWLKNGAYLLIEQTETLTVIDVNSGRDTGKANENAEETLWRTNLKAAAEIARQLRFRDIGGKILIDFIGMEKEEHGQAVVQQLTASLQADRNQTHVLGMTPSGLVELTRRKTRKSLLEKVSRPCPHCRGEGYLIVSKGFGKGCGTT